MTLARGSSSSYIALALGIVLEVKPWLDEQRSWMLTKKEQPHGCSLLVKHFCSSVHPIKAASLTYCIMQELYESCQNASHKQVSSSQQQLSDPSSHTRKCLSSEQTNVSECTKTCSWVPTGPKTKNDCWWSPAENYCSLLSKWPEMATAKFAETMKNPQHLMQLSLKGQIHTDPLSVWVWEVPTTLM
jgi:hypothetical protein